MSRDLIVDDEYFESLATFFSERYELETMLSSYLDVLKTAREDAVMGGEAAETMDAFIPYVELLDGKIADIQIDAHDLAEGFIAAIDAADSYLF